MQRFRIRGIRGMIIFIVFVLLMFFLAGVLSRPSSVPDASVRPEPSLAVTAACCGYRTATPHPVKATQKLNQLQPQLPAEWSSGDKGPEDLRSPCA